MSLQSSGWAGEPFDFYLGLNTSLSNSRHWGAGFDKGLKHELLSSVLYAYCVCCHLILSQCDNVMKCWDKHI